ncbi:terminase TerL endonuclease subunit [Anaerofustis sp. HA2171]|uniref:terminase TerL endonuclease subunit n=1 Tax=Anaerofustis butyriciformans TaxID=3108533 RepID=UPI002E2ECE2D|nr:terminase TerL endonuclease subunit [Anaerofustis sp. HA2171]
MRYFDKYEELIKDKTIPVSKEILLAINRVNYFKDNYIFKQEEADKRINFIEKECSNTKGIRAPLKLALPQKVWLEVSFGFYHNMEITKTDPETMEEYQTKEERRLIHETAIIMGRGSGKTTLAAAVGEVGQIADGEYGADVQELAYSREQAGYLFNANRAMTNYEESLLFLMRKADLLSSTKQGMLFRPTNSLMSIKTSDYESLDGTNAHFNIFDEVHTYDEDFIKVVNDGSSRKRKNWMTWYISTNGTKRDMVFDKYYNEWLDILNGKIKNDTIIPWIYKLDDVSEIKNPTMWVKSMPLLGITTEKESIALDIEMCKNDPVKQAELMAKTFNLPINNYLAYFTNEECRGNKDNFDFSIFQGSKESKAKVVIGLDLSSVNDICSVSFMIPKGDKFYFYAKKYMPRCRIDMLPKAQRDTYLKWEKEGYLHIHELDNNDQKYIFEDLREFMNENKIMPVLLTYDEWQSKEILRLFDDYYGLETFNVRQTTKMLSQPLKLYKAKITAGKIIFNDPVMSWCHSNVNVKIDANDNIFPNKQKAKDKIDVFASNLDCFVGYMKMKEEIQYYF